MEKFHFTGEKTKEILMKYLIESGGVKAGIDMGTVKLTAHNTPVTLSTVQIIIG